MSKTISELQKEVDNWINQFQEGYFPPLSILARLMEEVGELSREINHEFGYKKKKSLEEKRKIKEELGDILFTIICMANSLNINLEESLESVMEKHDSRDKERWTKKS